MALTPMMKQYLEIKENYKDYLLFFRLGDFYELFYEDAKIGEKELELVLTGKDCGLKERAPMCGMPFHSVEGYINTLVEKGYKVAICEQLEEASSVTAKRVVKRDVVRIVTPGTITNAEVINKELNNYLCSLYLENGTISIAFIDIFNGVINTSEFKGSEAFAKVMNEIGVYAPKEVITNADKKSIPKITALLENRMNSLICDNETKRFDYDITLNGIKRQSFERREYFLSHASQNTVKSVGALINYLCETQKKDVINIVDINAFSNSLCMEIDINTRRNLELCESISINASGTRNKKGSLLWVMDKTKTSQGVRTLRAWIEKPLLSCGQIIKRQTAISELIENFVDRERISQILSEIYDIERIVTKIMYGTANPKDLKNLEKSLKALPEMKEILSNFKCEHINEINNSIDALQDIYNLISNAIDEDPPSSVREGGILKDGFDEEVDRLRLIIRGGEEFMKKTELKEREKTGIKNLRIGCTKVSGYYIEITKSNLSQVPERYIRKQTLSNCERYITQELKEMEASISGAKESIGGVENKIFNDVCLTISDNAGRIQETATSLSILDALYSLAQVAIKNAYVCPEVDNSDIIDIKEGRHPVVELNPDEGIGSSDEYFVPNDVYLDTNENRLYIITGPNMAGKSTYMRQVAIITILAQIGSFVPASKARIGIVDKIFTRIGASDDLFAGQSTFMMEMNEVSYILKNATKNSLILYDEIGRGTSTFDGMSIARAVLEYTAQKKLSAKTLFSTHYHELTELEKQIDGVKNYHITARKQDDNVIFMRKIQAGAADDSYGIEVAKIAGIPNVVIERAREILKVLESGNEKSKKNNSEDNQVKKQELQNAQTAQNNVPMQNFNFEDLHREEIINKIKKLDLNIITPIEAFNILFDLKKMIKN